MKIYKWIYCLILCSSFLQAENLKTAMAVVKPSLNYQAKGYVTFTESPEGMIVDAHFVNLSPGKQGFHIHEIGECLPPDFSSAGGHFNPMGQIHAGPNVPKRHVGDLGNLVADDEGYATYYFVDPEMTFSGKNSIIGKSVVVHENADDLISQPSGASGARIACGQIKLIESK